MNWRGIAGSPLPGRWGLILLCLWLAPFPARAENTNGLSAAEMEGRALARKILEQRPQLDPNFLGKFQLSTNSGVLQMRDGAGDRTQIPIRCTTLVAPEYWEQVYDAGSTSHVSLVVIHPPAETNLYFYSTNGTPAALLMADLQLIGRLDQLSQVRQASGAELWSPFAGSDFWLCDLGLEFFHWPQQKVLKKEFHRQCACVVLESANPHPAPGGYSRVVSWIDEDSLGIVEAFAYDAGGRKFKNFYPKSLEKVNGRYQVESMVMENLLTGSRSVFEFDWHK